MHPLEAAILDTIREQHLLRAGDKVLACVSGGSDSLALLHLLLAARARLRLKLEVVHFDHSLRPESGWEAAWVKGQAQALGLPLHARRTTHLKHLAGGVQAAARHWRAAEMNELLLQTGAQAFATGHQRDDHLETLLLKLLRGCHLSQVQGMEWRSGAAIRPLLRTARATLRDYLRDLGQSWLEDPSNQSPRYLRNRVRQELLPLLDDLAGGAMAARLETLERQSRALEAWLEQSPQPVQSDPAGPPHWMEVKSLLALPTLARGSALFRFVQRRLPGELDYGRVQAALALLENGKTTWSLDLPLGRVLQRRAGRVLLKPRAAAVPAVTHPLDDVTLIAPTGWQVLGGRRLPPDDDEGLWLGKVPPGAELELRQRLPGDRFHPLWRARAVRVSAFLRDQHVPPWERDRLPLVVLNGEVVAIYPHFVAKAHALTEEEPDAFYLSIEGW